MEPWESRVRLSGGGGNAREGGLSGRTSALPGLSVLREHRFVVVVGEWIVEPGLGRVAGSGHLTSEGIKEILI
jgi:hypothetical protein